MKFNRFLIYSSLAIVATLALTACNSTGKYVNKDGSVYFSYWTFSFGTIDRELPDVDPATFKAVEDWLGHDDNHVYFKDNLIENADPKTLKAEKYPMFRDRKDYYYMTAALRVSDMESFKVLKRSDDDIWARDSRYAYYDSLRIETPDIESFRVVAHNTAVDSKNVYRYGKILPLADPATYEETWKGFYSRDKAHIWYMGTLLEDADYATFVVDDDTHAHDSKGSFHREERVK